ncbi:hypothetical protein TTRE_0000714201 [Trichuris trichiura]|uniref:Uncharacterized protein n=1 Tax=Trichuris trichiura TaxID=36087 RepID=A0A077ZEK8_TRITR|nr:hypothetical protein TTRE_0000714201 [Trichuris trichiura]
MTHWMVKFVKEDNFSSLVSAVVLGGRHRQHSRSPRKTLDSTRDRRPTSNRNEGASLVEYGSNDSLDGLEEKSRDLPESGKSGKEGNRHTRKRGFDKDECMKYMSKKQMKELRAQYLSTDTSEVSDGDLVQNFPLSYSSEGSSENKDLVDQKTVTDTENLEFVLPRSYQKHQAFVEKGLKVEKEKKRTKSPVVEASGFIYNLSILWPFRFFVSDFSTTCFPVCS